MVSKALGLIEAVGFPATIEAADAALKAANVTLIGYDLTRGGGMITVKVVGDVGAVNAAVSAGVAAAQRVGKVAACHVIPRPHAEVEALIAQITRPKPQPTPPALPPQPAPAGAPPKPPRPSKPATPKAPKATTKPAKKPVQPQGPQAPEVEAVASVPDPEVVEPTPGPEPVELTPPPAPEQPDSEG